jgi:uncharacterized membrane protein
VGGWNYLVSGFALLIVVYYLGGGALIDHDVRDISLGAAVGIGIACDRSRLACLRPVDAVASWSQ